MTENFGPLNGINCFLFEELNREMLRFIHGFDLIGKCLEFSVIMLKDYTHSNPNVLFTHNIKNKFIKVKK